MTWSCLKRPLLEAWGAGGYAMPSRGSRTGEDREEPSWSAVPESFYSALSSLCSQGPWGKPAVCPGAQGKPRRGLWLAGLMFQADPTGSRSGPPGGEVETQMCRVGRTGSEGGGGRRDQPGLRSKRPKAGSALLYSEPAPTWVGGQPPGRVRFISRGDPGQSTGPNQGGLSSQAPPVCGLGQ